MRSRLALAIVCVVSPVLTCVASAARMPASAQEPGQQAVGPGRFAGAQRAAGEVVAVHGDTLQIRTAAGEAMTIVTTTNTRIMRGPGVTVKLADLKPGDGVLAVGQLDAPNHALHAMFVVSTSAAEMAKLRADLGKTYVTGKVTAVDTDALRVTVLRPDGVSQTFAVDESTSFRRLERGRGMGGGAGGGAGALEALSGDTGTASADAGESITFADVKVGESIAATGALQKDVFVARRLGVFPPREHRQRPAGDAPATESAH